MKLIGEVVLALVFIGLALALWFVALGLWMVGLREEARECNQTALLLFMTSLATCADVLNKQGEKT